MIDKSLLLNFMEGKEMEMIIMSFIIAISSIYEAHLTDQALF